MTPAQGEVDMGTSENQRINKSADQQISKSANRQIDKSANRRMGESWNLQTANCNPTMTFDA
jgi:hypothetical protein